MFSTFIALFLRDLQCFNRLRTLQKKDFQPFKKETKYKYTIKWCNFIQDSIAQLVEHWTGKWEDPGSNPASASFFN